MLLHREAFQFLGRPVYWYGVCVALGFVAGMIVLHRRGRRVGIGGDQVSDLVTSALVGGIVGARLFYVLFTGQLQYFLQNPIEILRIDKGGLVFYGGFLGATALVIWYARRQKLALGKVTDLMVCGLPLGHALGRLGCFLNGCCFGKLYDGPGAVTYLADFSRRLGLEGREEGHVSVFYHQFVHGWLRLEEMPPLGPEPAERLVGSSHFPQLVREHFGHLHVAEAGEHVYRCLPLWPSQLVQAVANLLVFAAVLWLATRLQRTGRLTAIFLVIYPGARFLTEFGRGDYPTRTLGLTNAQLVALPLIAAGIWLWFRLGRLPLPDAPHAEPTPEPAPPDEKE